MDSLESNYQQQFALYEEEVASPTPDVNKLKNLNLQISNTLHAMIEALTNVRNETANIKMYRDDLISRLKKIQWDYNGLIQNTDQLETLRRIRESERARVDKSVNFYLILFLIACAALLIVILFKRQIVSYLPSLFFPQSTQLLPLPSAPIL
jgi:hypothetical protein